MTMVSSAMAALESSSALQVSRRREDRDAAERMKGEQIVVARHDHVRAPVHRDVEEFVIRRIARAVDRLDDFNDFNQGCQAEE